MRKDFQKLITELQNEGLSEYGIILLEGFAVVLDNERLVSDALEEHIAEFVQVYLKDNWDILDDENSIIASYRTYCDDVMDETY